MIKKLSVFLVILVFGATCNAHNSTIFLNNTHEIVYKRSYCNPERNFPQMILIPYFNQASQVVPNCDTYPVYKTAMALFIFYHQWLKYFGDKDMAVRGMLENVMIQWDTKKRSGFKGFDLKGERIEPDRNIIGLVESKNIIWVWEGYNHKISESALIHELVHLALRAKNGHADADHEGLKYRGWTFRHTKMIIESKQMLRAFEL